MTSSLTWAHASSSSVVTQAADVTCSKLSSTSRTWRSRRRSASASRIERAGTSPTPTARPSAQDQAVGVAAGRHVDERDAVAKPRRLLAGGPDGQARLARSARARQRQQPDRRILEVALDRFELGPAADERRRRDRQARRAVVDGHQRRERRFEVRMDQLEDALRAAEVLEPELAEVAQAGAGREAIGAERGGRRG